MSAATDVGGHPLEIALPMRGRDGDAEPSAASAGLRRRRRRRLITFGMLVACVLVLVTVSACVGQYPVSASDVWRALASRIGLAKPVDDPVVIAALWNIRFPRIVLGLLIGASLAVAGTVMQAVFSNPLAEPGIIGVSSGSAVGASVAIVLVPHALGGFSVPLAAFCSGLFAAMTVYLLSRSGGRADVLTLVLVGIAITAVCTALTSIATYLAPTAARDQIVFWQMGSLGGATWMQVAIVGAIALVALPCAVLLSPSLDTLALGESAAGHVGLNVGRLRLVAIALSALLTAAAVSYAGVIAFVGLIVPHVLRLAIGPLNRFLIPATMLGGAALITLSDTVARTLIPFADLPIGIFTALVGGPTFFILLRTKLRGGGRMP
ncbi:iron ABC transporter permease [Actinobaculum sp. 313]|uniref:FecCD family ABC transporter permease n=1 Tax=Actinobaculum sp. 313 TaxID=2495645 RepID=UPI001F0B8583|nr:iron ABC transporter permease [Actinobaculum sp. 313]